MLLSPFGEHTGSARILAWLLIRQVPLWTKTLFGCFLAVFSHYRSTNIIAKSFEMSLCSFWQILADIGLGVWRRGRFLGVGSSGLFRPRPPFWLFLGNFSHFRPINIIAKSFELPLGSFWQILANIGLGVWRPGSDFWGWHGFGQKTVLPEKSI